MSISLTCSSAPGSGRRIRLMLMGVAPPAGTRLAGRSHVRVVRNSRTRAMFPPAQPRDAAVQKTHGRFAPRGQRLCGRSSGSSGKTGIESRQSAPRPWLWPRGRKAPMGFDIYLPEARIAASRGLWPDRLPVDYLDDAVRERPDATAFVGWNSALAREVRLTYAELGARVDRIAAGLLERGVRKGDVVAFQLPNWWEFTALLFACNRIGAVANPLMPIFRQRELRFMLGFAEAKVAIVPALWRGFDHLAMLREIGPELPRLEHVFAVGGSGESSFERAFLDRPALSSTERQRLAGLRPGPNDVVELIYTSGTSGQPKAVMHTANTVLAPAQCFIDDIGLSGRD